MSSIPDLWIVLKIMFCAAIGTAGILLPILAIPILVFLLIRYMKKSNKDHKGE